MRSCLGFFVFLFVFLPLTFCGLLTGAVSTWLFDRSFYVDLFSAEGLYAAFVGDNLELRGALELGDGTLPPETANAFGQAIQASVTPPTSAVRSPATLTRCSITSRISRAAWR